MSLAIKYESVEDARMRLRGTVVLYRGLPVYITEVSRGEGDEKLRVHYTEIPKKGNSKMPPGLEDLAEEPKAVRKYISSKFFDIAPFKMGYVNTLSGTGAFYCTRLPNRVQKQGLCGENLRATDNYGRRIDFATIIRTKEFNDMVAGNYPSVDVALRALGKTKAVAFHREFCLVKDEVIESLVYIYHKAVKVGMYSRETGKVLLGQKFLCLKETLAELGLETATC